MKVVAQETKQTVTVYLVNEDGERAYLINDSKMRFAGFTSERFKAYVANLKSQTQDKLSSLFIQYK